MNKVRVPCGENVWSHKDDEGNFVRGHLKPCPNKAKTMARHPGDIIWTPLCLSHLNTDRWANWVDLEVRDLPKLAIDTSA